MTSAVIDRASADFAALALKEVLTRLRAKGEDRAAERLQAVSDALSADMVHVVTKGGHA